MSLFNLGGWPAKGWYYSDEKYGLLGNNFSTNNLLPTMYRGSHFSGEWSWVHGGVTSKDVVANERLPKNVIFFYGNTKEIPNGVAVVCKAGFLCSRGVQDKLNTDYGFEKGGDSWGWTWTHPWMCTTTIDNVPMNEFMVFPASQGFSKPGFKSIGTHQILVAKNSTWGKYESSYNNSWDWRSFDLVSPPNDIQLVIEHCKSSITNANKPECANIMKSYCSPHEIKSTGNNTCNLWCSQNPSMCDSIKVNFCGANPDDSFCDCINHSSRAAYIEEMKLLRPESRNLPLVCNTRICNTRNDLVDVFHTSSYLRDKLSYKCPPLQIIDQSVNVNGSGNTVTADQKVSNTTVGGSGTGSGGDTNDDSGVQSNTIYLFALLFIILVVIIVMSMSDDAPPTVAFVNRPPLRT